MLNVFVKGVEVLKLFVSLGFALGIAGCTTVEMIDGSGATPLSSNCNVRVYQTRRQAEKLGELEELCIINGTSSMSFVHSVAVAVEKHKDKACACGATNVFIESRHQTGFDLATVTMVAFRVVNAASTKSTPSSTATAIQPASVTTKAPEADSESARVVQFLSDNGFVVVEKPVRFKQKGNLNFYEARGSKGKITQVLCEAGGGACRLRTPND